MHKIQNPVGVQGKNDLTDVRVIQHLLNRCGTVGKKGRPMAVDGVAGPATIDAIKDFQDTFLDFGVPDGKIEPGKATIRKLLEIAEEFPLMHKTN